VAPEKPNAEPVDISVGAGLRVGGRWSSRDALLVYGGARWNVEHGSVTENMGRYQI
jgi:hypothetical protein